MCYSDILWLLGTFVNSSCDIKINVNIVQNCCRNLAVRGLNEEAEYQRMVNWPIFHDSLALGNGDKY